MEYRNILLIKMSSLGDVLHTLPFVAVLRDRFPKARITWLVHPQFSGFVPDPPMVDEVLYFDKKKFNQSGWAEKWRTLKRLRAALHARHFDLVIDMQGLAKSALMALLSGCPNRIGYGWMREGSGLVSRPVKGAHARDHVIEQYLDVARYLGCQVDDIRFPMPDLGKEWESLRAKCPLDLTQPYVVFCPGARWETKKWPAEQYAALARLILADGSGVVLAGGPDDKELGARIAALTPGVTDLTGQTSLRELGALISHCAVYISGDTGPLFIAAAFKKPLIALYGPTKADRTGPYGSDASTILVASVPCAGCLKKHCDDWKCMTALTPERVFQEYKEKRTALRAGERK
ncbi:MAG: lipopolysaccharide heptosyltransferase I [Acidaminococcaceae bacterium]|nr:lipopolysaccharide heptosyltransferase I [Acidaminococcaceae bacterium]